MKKEYLINSIFFTALAIWFWISTPIDFTLLALATNTFMVIVYTSVLRYVIWWARIFFIIIITTLAYVITLINIIAVNVKGGVITVSSINLIDELLGVSDGAKEGIKLEYIVMLVVTIIVIMLLLVFSNKERSVLTSSKGVKFVCTALIILVLSNLVDPIQFKYVYNPNEYTEEFGMGSFYTRELAGFTVMDLEIGPDSRVSSEPLINEYSGIFADKKNVVFIVGESLSYRSIDAQLTPALYEVYRSGLSFENYYTLSTNTNASEFSTLTSLYPPVDYSKVPNYSEETESLGKIFEEQGFCTTGFHANTEKYYNRGDTYPNLYGFSESYFVGDEDFVKHDDDWPRDDETFELSIPFIEERDCEKNVSYYMTITGHLLYNLETRPTVIDNYNVVDSIYPEYDEYLKVYLATQMFFDKMIADMAKYYWEQGELDETVFVITSDHHPYALTDPEYPVPMYSNEYSDEFENDIELSRVPFIIYDPMSTFETNDNYGSSIDVIPTLADMFGIELDGSLIHGQSLLNDGEDYRVMWLGTLGYAFVDSENIYYKGEFEGEMSDSKLNDLEEIMRLFSVSHYQKFK